MSCSLSQNAAFVFAFVAVGICGTLVREPPPPSSDASAEPMLLHASGACLARIVRLEEQDERPSDGDHWVKAWLDISQSSGTIPEYLYLVVQPGGQLIREGDLPTTPSILRHDSLQVGERHWFVFSEDYDSAKYPPNVAGWWPYEEGTVPKDVIAAIESDRFAGNPVWDPTLNVVYEAFPDRKAKTVRVAVRDADSLAEDAIRFERTVVGEFANLLLHHWAWSYEMDWPAREELHVVSVWVIGNLPAGNRFHRPAGTYRIEYAFDLKTGRLLAVWIAQNQEIWMMQAFQQYDRETGELIIDMQFDFLPTGGLEAGGDSEQWYRRVVKRYEHGRLQSEEVFRHPYIKTGKERIYSSSGWVPVEN